MASTCATRAATVAAIAAILAGILAASAGAQQIGFTQTASGGSLRPFDNRAPSVASRTDGTSLAPLGGTVTRTESTRMRIDSGASPFTTTAPTIESVTTSTGSEKNGGLAGGGGARFLGFGGAGSLSDPGPIGVPVPPVGALLALGSLALTARRRLG